ncbi:MAG: hypothetical protein KFF50_00780 [Desulfatitalea sp.]|nr:hypothetical protein [Desulfatitalea sp.]
MEGVDSQLSFLDLRAACGYVDLKTSLIGGIRAGDSGVDCVSKASVIMMTQVMAKEWGNTISGEIMGVDGGRVHGVPAWLEKK